ncbi:MAG: hypothetical protein ACFFCM_02145 [Promethearchaeota archaeon]
MQEIINWFEDIIENWKKIINLNNKIATGEKILEEEKQIIFPFIPFEIDCYTCFNFFSESFPKLFTENGDSLILIQNDSHDQIIWSAAQYEENGNYLDFLKFEIQNSEEILSLIKEGSIEKIADYVHNLEVGFNPNFNLNFIIIIDIRFLEGLKKVHDSFKFEFLDYITALWNLLAQMYKEERIQIYNPPLFFEFLHKFITDNENFDAITFKNVLTKLLPPQNVVFSLVNENKTVSFAILTTPYKFVFTFLGHERIEQRLKKIKIKKHFMQDIMAELAKQLHKKYRIFYNEKYLKVNTTFVIKFEILDYFKDIMSKYRFKNFLIRLAEFITKSDDFWTSDGKIVLFRRWGKSFFDFDLRKLNPPSILSYNRGLHFIYGYRAKTLVFIFDQNIKLQTIFGLDLKNGSLEKFYIIPKEQVNSIFKKEKDIEKALLNVKHKLSEQFGSWISTIIGVKYTDLNKFSAILSMATSVPGSLKFLKILDNFIKYQALFLPLNPLIDLMQKEGSIKTLKKLYFPLILQD